MPTYFEQGHCGECIPVTFNEVIFVGVVMAVKLINLARSWWMRCATIRGACRALQVVPSNLNPASRRGAGPAAAEHVCCCSQEGVAIALLQKPITKPKLDHQVKVLSKNDAMVVPMVKFKGLLSHPLEDTPRHGASACPTLSSKDT